MHDTDNDGMITLEEYRHVSLRSEHGAVHAGLGHSSINVQRAGECGKLFLSVQVVEELLSRSGALGKETAKSIADAAMLEVASISMGHMVGRDRCEAPLTEPG